MKGYIHRKLTKDKKIITGYHAQDYRVDDELSLPIESNPKNAWLGVGFYFWVEEEFAHYWGQDFKKESTGYYDIYKGDIEEENLLNASFSELGYFTFRNSIEYVLEHFRMKGMKLDLVKVNRFLADHIWSRLGVDGIIYDDLPNNPPGKERTYSEIPPLYYKKRIQIVVFNVKIIRKFALYKSELC